MITESITDETLVKKNDLRKPFVAFLLSVFFTGLGQMYNGQFRKGIIFFLLSYIILFVSGICNLLISFNGFVVIFILFSILKLYNIIDAVLVARNLKVFTRTKFNTWYFYLLFSIIALIINSVFSTQKILKLQTFIFTTSSGYPTTLIGDRIVSNLNFDKLIKVNYGDMLAFYSPNYEVWTFRVVGLPGDKIEIKNRELIINGLKLKTTFEKEAIDGEYEVSQFLEELPNGFKHSIFRYNGMYDSSYENVPEVILPTDYYFLLGDNRDNAYDSRYIGPVNKRDIFAQVMYVFWSSDLNRIGLDFRKSK